DFIFRKFIPEVVIASSTYPLDIFPARKISRRFSAKLIFEVHDLWPLSPIELGDFSKYNPLMALFQWAENYYCRHAGKVVSILPNTLPYLEEHGLAKEKFVHVPNGVVIQNESAESLSAGEKQQIDEFSGRYKFIIGYAGAHGKANDLESFISALELLRDQGIAGVLIGKGNEKEALKAIVQRKKLENVLFLEPVRKNRIASLLKEFDALYIGLMNRPLFRFGLSPNKLFDYMLAGKPIIHAINSDWNLVEKAHCGVSCQAGDPDSIAHAIITLSSMSPEERIKRGENGFFYVRTNHSYEYLANKFLKAL
ncbi:MAG: glycosyltransferase family 4 protein, partial [Candidatus Zixiibacteriota bacterium]